MQIPSSVIYLQAGHTHKNNVNLKFYQTFAYIDGKTSNQRQSKTYISTFLGIFKFKTNISFFESSCF